MKKRFAKFAVVGTFGFLLDATVLSIAVAMHVDPFMARILSFACAVTLTWYLNRVITFRDHDPRWFSQYGRVVSVNAVGGLINIATYAALIAVVPILRDHLIIAVALGSGAGMIWNFLASHHSVFKKTD